MAQRIAGTLFVKLDGQQFEVAMESVSAPLKDNANEAIMSVTGLAGRKETAQRQYLKFTGLFTPDFPIQSLRNVTNGTLTAEFASGPTYTLAGAYLEGETEVDGFEGKVSMEFTGTTGTWS